MAANRIDLYNSTSLGCSKLTTKAYSTSFALGVMALDKSIRPAIYSIYGFVRFADEIVDSFHSYNKQELLEEFKNTTYKAIEKGISTNPILQSFQLTVNSYNIPTELIEAFLHSMEQDLHKSTYSRNEINDYIYGSAEVVGLMCLKVFCNGNSEQYQKLKVPARRLGAAFQKINFFVDLGRVYFPNINFAQFSNEDKQRIEADILLDFEEAYKGIKMLPKEAQLGVLIAYKYYLRLFKKIRRTNPQQVLQQRYRISNVVKFWLLTTTALKVKIGLS
ncbi:All-trans-phytoene synthase [anaerobic digester metagenome]